jgi:ClpP class serine protease
MGPITINPGQAVQQELDRALNKIERHLEGDRISFVGEILFGIDNFIRAVVESIPAKRKKLVVILETPGGYAEVVQRINSVFRKHYERVDFIMPNFAMSTGTILVMSGDNIYMDDYAVLGPIDPQVESKSGQTVPALGYLERYEQLIAKSAAGTLTTAELNILVDGFDQAELYRYDQAKRLAITLLKEWLVKYKFKNWSVTEGRKLPVDDVMKEGRAEDIASALLQTDKWHSHGRGIPMNVLRDDVKIRIDDFLLTCILTELSECTMHCS